MQTVTTIGLDIARSVFQVHGVDAVGQVVIGRQLKRRYVLAFFEKLFLQVECATIPSSCKNTAAPVLKHRQKSARSRAVSPSCIAVVIVSWRSFRRWARPPTNLSSWPIK